MFTVFEVIADWGDHLVIYTGHWPIKRLKMSRRCYSCLLNGSKGIFFSKKKNTLIRVKRFVAALEGNYIAMSTVIFLNIDYWSKAFVTIRSNFWVLRKLLHSCRLKLIFLLYEKFFVAYKHEVFFHVLFFLVFGYFGTEVLNEMFKEHKKSL